jgi:hypothetical protein
MKQFLLKLSWWIDLSKWKQWLWPNYWGWFRLLIPYVILFNKPWIIHDYQYWIGQNKKQADLMFYRLCLSLSKNNLQKFFSLLYFLLVKYFWFIFYKWKKN